MFTGYTRAYQGTRGNCVYRVHEGLQGTRGLNRVDELTAFTGYMGDYTR